MNNLALQLAGGLAIMAALGHGVLGDRMLHNQPIEPLHIFPVSVPTLAYRFR